MQISQICIYCASSDKCDPLYLDAARRLGKYLAQNNIGIIYGGGSSGLMGHLADGALEAGGRVTGIIPRFMDQVEWGHQGLTELRVVDDMHQRKRLMLESADAVAALPGGCGTLEELFEAIAWKRLGLFVRPIAIININGFFDPCLNLLDCCIAERFMNPDHRKIWTVVQMPEDLLSALHAAPAWNKDAIRSARVQ